ncbi:SMC-Scp complex subunit ScpB [Arenicella xantha]|uniref:Segregation and condensation protein B n=1 Tax=Arenicella xantha TaxID=644221 RepID=A0A395JLC3_9GAMM|nr:SMC-Scp complex subunit ScpB [Arenicella xantha]RBP51511.1 segregation and condensation protein B [Arenicella xantha]
MTQKNIDMAQKETDKEVDQDLEETNESNQTPDKDAPIDSELANIVEAALFAAKVPLGVRKIISLFPDDAQPSTVDIQNVLLTLEKSYASKGVELRRIGNGWRFQSKEKYSPWLRKLRGDKAPRYSRALLETLSIIAYRQPVTRGDIEDIRGVGVSSDTIRVLEERDWIAQIGHRDVPGRPALFGTTQGFLEYFNMTSLRELPELMDKRALGEVAKDMNLTLPMDGVKDVNGDDKPESAQVIELRRSTDDDELADPVDSIDNNDVVDSGDVEQPIVPDEAVEPSDDEQR